MKEYGDNKSAKKLQVFTQIISAGTQNIVMTTIRDMSYWLELEKQKNITQTQTLAFASAAHEFRNPLNAIVASLELLDPLIDHQRGNQYFSIAKSCSNLMLFLVRDILDFAQIESQSLVLSF
jgi:signal transduction histidine kinase